MWRVGRHLLLLLLLVVCRELLEEAHENMAALDNMAVLGLKEIHGGRCEVHVAQAVDHWGYLRVEGIVWRSVNGKTWKVRALICRIPYCAFCICGCHDARGLWGDYATFEVCVRSARWVGVCVAHRPGLVGGIIDIEFAFEGLYGRFASTRVGNWVG